MKRIIHIVFAISISTVILVGCNSRDSREEAGRKAYLCVDNLRSIDAAKQSYALEHQLKPGDLIPEEELKKLGAWPKVCPSGGKYTMNPVGKDPTCSVFGHKLIP